MTPSTPAEFAAFHRAGAPVLPSQEDLRDHVFGSLADNHVDAPHRWNLRRLAAASDLRPFADFVKTQDSNDCVGNGTATTLEAQQAARGVQRVYSPKFVYYAPRAAYAEMLGVPVQDQGTDVFSALREARKNGVCQEHFWESWRPANERPSPAAWTDAATRRGMVYERLGRVSFNHGTGQSVSRDAAADFMVAVACKMPVILAMPIKPSFYGIRGNLLSHPAQFEQSFLGDPNGAGNHCLAGMAYVTAPDGQVLAVAENSWGAGHGDGGYLAIPLQQLAETCFDMAVVREFDGMRWDIPMELYSWQEACREAEAWRLYRAALGRLPDAEGLMYQAKDLAWIGAGAVAQNFLNSPEFRTRYGALENRQFVTALYQNVLNRQPEPSGLGFHVETLERAERPLSRAEVLRSFAESPENKANARAEGFAYA